MSELIEYLVAGAIGIFVGYAAASLICVNSNEGVEKTQQHIPSVEHHHYHQIPIPHCPKPTERIS